MKNRLLSNASQVLALVLIVAIGATGIAVLRPDATPSTASTAMTQSQAAPEQPDATLAGLYSGPVALKVTLGGVYSDTLATPTRPPAGTPVPADVGEIDLSLFLSQTGNTVRGYVSLDKTLVFSVEHTIQATPVGVTPAPGATLAAVALRTGPVVQGSFNGTTLNLQSERVTVVVAGRTVQRQFRIIGTLKPGDANTLIGEYRETVWGYASQPLTVLGTFALRRPSNTLVVPNTGNATPTVTATARPISIETATPRPGANRPLYLPLIRR